MRFDPELKRSIDLLGAALILLICAPLMLLIALLLPVSAGAPLLHRELRVGRQQVPFTLYKFRSMKLDGDASSSTVATSDDSRVHDVGRWLRRTHLDELPQLFNVLRGDMSLVGPRPYKPEHFDHLSESDRPVISSVRPGLTGTDALYFIAEDAALAGQDDPEQVYLNYALPEKARLQCLYVKSSTLWSDLCILARTPVQLLSGQAKRKSVKALRRLWPDHSD